MTTQWHRSWLHVTPIMTKLTKWQKCRFKPHTEMTKLSKLSELSKPVFVNKPQFVNKSVFIYPCFRPNSVTVSKPVLLVKTVFISSLWPVRTIKTVIFMIFLIFHDFRGFGHRTVTIRSASSSLTGQRPVLEMTRTFRPMFSEVQQWSSNSQTPMWIVLKKCSQQWCQQWWHKLSVLRHPWAKQV